ncbi:MAG: hypothetical protein CVU34_18040 [Betaproteobacteria bacterium HGW-Betaproteobacteria-7]|jgi:hypothetical protein|nr:MAG: hypothetical protein CVU34_18040 [Betaproteobacteria bacterium HGW-Betaproteobacteria-7]
MNKSILVAALVAIALTACGKKEEPQVVAPAPAPVAAPAADTAAAPVATPAADAAAAPVAAPAADAAAAPVGVPATEEKK